MMAHTWSAPESLIPPPSPPPAPPPPSPCTLSGASTGDPCCDPSPCCCCCCCLEGVLHPDEVGERWKGEDTVGAVPTPLSVRFMTVELKYASKISRGSSLSSIRACTLMLLDRMRVDPPDTGTEGDSSALPDSERNPYSPSFLYGSGYWGGSASCTRVS